VNSFEMIIGISLLCIVAVVLLLSSEPYNIYEIWFVWQIFVLRFDCGTDIEMLFHMMSWEYWWNQPSS